MSRTLRRFLFLPFLLFPIAAFLGCGEDPSTTNPPSGDDATLAFGGAFDGDEVVLERLVTDTPEGPVRIDLVADRVEVDVTTGVVEADVALRNRSDRTVGLPALVFLGAYDPSTVRLLNGDNQVVDFGPDDVPPEGPYPDWFDYGGTFGNDGLLGPGETSDARTWRFEVPGGVSFAFGAAVRVGLDPSRPTISGRVFFDDDLDGELDDDELPFGAGMVQVTHADGYLQRTMVDDTGRWRVPIRRTGLYSALYLPPPTAGPLPWSFSTPNPLEILITPSSTGEPQGFDGADFGIAEELPPPPPPPDDVVILSDGPADSVQTDPYRLLDARITMAPPADGTRPVRYLLEVRVGYSGCSPGHPLLAYAGRNFVETAPPQTWLRLSHDDRGELCDAWWEEWRRFDLTPLVEHYVQVYGGPVEFVVKLEAPDGTEFSLPVR